MMIIDNCTMFAPNKVQIFAQVWMRYGFKKLR